MIYLRFQLLFYFEFDLQGFYFMCFFSPKRSFCSKKPREFSQKMNVFSENRSNFRILLVAVKIFIIICYVSIKSIRQNWNSLYALIKLNFQGKQNLKFCFWFKLKFYFLKIRDSKKFKNSTKRNNNLRNFLKTSWRCIWLEL